MKYGKNKKRNHKKRWVKLLLRRVVVSFFCALVIALSALAAVHVWHVHSAAVLSNISVCFQGEAVTITWDTPLEMDACRLFRYDEGKEEYVPWGEYPNGIIMMDIADAGEAMKLRLQAVRYIKFLGHKAAFFGVSRELEINPTEITDIILQMSVDPENRMVSINWPEDKYSAYEVYLFEDHGKCRLYSETASNMITLDFANDFALPDRSDPIRIAVRAVRKEKGYTLYSPMSESVYITRADLLQNDLFLCWQQEEDRQYVLSWQECSGSWYEVQQWSEQENQWVSKQIFNWEEDMIYRTGHLPSNTQVRFRVITYDSVEERNQEEFKTVPSEVAFHTELSPLYCTIWPVVPLKILDKPQGGEILGEAPAGQALCVLAEDGGYFKIMYKDCLGYIDSRFCMINLPEYMGDLCIYDITNSISSIFRVHGYDIPEITDSVVKGYENIYLGNGDYLVPYLYPCTVKLYQAASDAAADGYSLCIYDAFRPNEATRYLYDTVEAVLDEPVMKEDDEDGEEDEMTQMSESENVETPEMAQMPESVETPEMAQTSESVEMPEMAQTDTDSEDAEVPEEDYETYRSVMTDGRYHLSSFLAASVSAHNRGIALDLVLVDADTKESLLMQSDMHDLSWYSAISQNNENALLLAKYMKGVGYNDLSSEWWHFQDDETRNEIGLDSYLSAGVSVEGWKKDDIGWKYRLKDGSFYKDRTVLIDGRERTFDAEGYCTKESPQG